MKVIHWLVEEIKKVWILSFFFIICFSYIFVILNLFLKTYAIDFYGISKVIIGALIAAKAVLILDKTPLINWCERFPRYIHLLYKTLIYSLGVVLFGVVEGLIHAYSESHQWQEAIEIFIASKNLNSFIATHLSIGVVFFLYSILSEVESKFGQGWIGKFFLSSPDNAQ